MTTQHLRFSGVLVFLSVAAHQSFRQAALELALSPAAVSKIIRQFEQQHGVVLFQRTTRSVTLTEAGQVLYDRLQPATASIDEALMDLHHFQSQPSGVLRLTLSRSSMRFFAESVIEEFYHRYPQVALEISVDDEFVELASGKFDAGIRLGESVEQDMVAVRLTKNLRWAVLGSPDYFSRYGYPEKPEDLISHQAIHYRFAGSGQLYEWEFKREGNSVRVAIPGRLTINDRSSLLSMARRGLGLVYVSDIEAAEDLQSGNLKSILLDYIPESSGLYLYFPTRMQTQPKLKAFIEVATRDLRAGYPPFPKAP